MLQIVVIVRRRVTARRNDARTIGTRLRLGFPRGHVGVGAGFGGYFDDGDGGGRSRRCLRSEVVAGRVVLVRFALVLAMALRNPARHVAGRRVDVRTGCTDNRRHSRPRIRGRLRLGMLTRCIT